jgi:hypothetical protein
MILLRIKNILVSVNKKTNDAFFILSSISLLFIGTCLLMANGHGLVPLSDNNNYVLIILAGFLNSIVYSMILFCMVLLVYGLNQLSKLLMKIFRAFKEATLEEFKIKPSVESNKKAKITF